MADWTNLPNQAVGVGGLPSGTTVTALRDNPVAIAQGAAGAPRVQTKALEGPVAGDTHVINNLQLGTVGSNGTIYPSTQANRLASAEQHVGVLCLVDGSIRCAAQHRRATTGTRTSFLRILRNGTQLIEWQTTSSSFQSRQLDVTVSAGDIVVFQQRISNSDNSSEWRNIRILSANPNLTVV